jgi:RNA-directed DNA polymerase
MIVLINRTLMGWFEYFKHSRPRTFVPLDAWIRMRLRSVLRQRHGGRGRGRGLNHYRWPNAYFVSAGKVEVEGWGGSAGGVEAAGKFLSSLEFEDF